MRKNWVKLRPRLVTAITASFMIVSTLVSSVAIVNNSINVKKIEETRVNLAKAMEEETDPTANWDLNRVNIVYDPDGVPVPVPKGWTASSVESERYVNHNVEKTGTLSNLTFTPGEKTWEHDESDTDKAWILNEDNVWVSQNYHVASSEAELVSDEFTVGEDGGHLNIEWSISSQAGSSSGTSQPEDILTLTIMNTQTQDLEELYSIRGTIYGSTYSKLKYSEKGMELSAGTYRVVIKYTKSSSTSHKGLDSGYVKNVTVINYDDIGTDKIRVHEYGGLVIYEGERAVTEDNAYAESKIRNQFVWIPVANIGRICEKDSVTNKKKAKLWLYNEYTGLYKVLSEKREPYVLGQYDTIRSFLKGDMYGYTMDSFYKELQIEFNKTMESIEKYGGFYIGRYETGNLNYSTPGVIRFNDNLDNQGWYIMYSKMKKISQNDNIQTNMIFGCLFDEALQWIVDTEEKTEIEVWLDSTEWGNHINSKFSYNNGGENLSIKNRQTFSRIRSGCAEKNKANNIYDLAGNVYDTTIEVDSSGRYHIRRGGECRDAGIVKPIGLRGNTTGGGGASKYCRLSCIFLY